MFAWTCVSSVVPLSRSKNLSLPQLRSPHPPLRHPPNLANETNSPGPSFWVSVWAAVAGSKGSPSQKIDGSCKDTDRPTAVAISSDKRGKCRQRREGSVGGEEEEGQGADMAIFVPWNRYGIKGSGTLCHYPGTRTEERPPATENKNILQIYFYYAKIIAHRPMAVAHKYGKWKINGNSIVICTYTVESLHY